MMMIDMNASTLTTVMIASIGAHALFMKLSIDTAIQKAMKELHDFADDKFVTKESFDAHVKMCPHVKDGD